jgi:hypothetical protein
LAGSFAEPANPLAADVRGLSQFAPGIEAERRVSPTQAFHTSILALATAIETLNPASTNLQTIAHCRASHSAP